ncbi:MAG: thermonuclease family protein [Patescibacteria group bacterium]|nr:thermonuclease family protein [Patescibacteria group bacterium]
MTANKSQEDPKKKSNKKTVILCLITIATLFPCAICGSMSMFTSEDTKQGDQAIGDAVTDEQVMGEQIEERQVCEVIKVVDGDTIKISYEGSTESVRLIGIDTPETVHPQKPVECFGQEASNTLKDLLEDEEVYIEFDPTQGEEDTYGRLLLYLWRVSDGMFINDYMIREGYAHEYTYNLPYEYQEQFKAAEKDARNSSRGLWGNVCGCEKDVEKSRECIGCRMARVTYSNWDCSTYTIDVDDDSCTNGCYVPPAVSSGVSSSPAPTPGYTCDCSKTCSQMSSCEEAYYQLNTCGCGVRDGDNDGVPCESICPGV